MENLTALQAPLYPRCKNPYFDTFCKLISNIFISLKEKYVEMVNNDFVDPTKPNAVFHNAALYALEQITNLVDINWSSQAKDYKHYINSDSFIRKMVLPMEYELIAVLEMIQVKHLDFYLNIF